LGHLEAGEKVAITTRFHSPEVLEYKKAMERRGLIVRVIAGLKDMEDFCFLYKAKRGLAGNVISTFFKWAALLGQAERVQMYILDSKGLRRRFTRRGQTVWNVFAYNWTNPNLKSRLLYVPFIHSKN
jgi:hypothetical protein